jgi:hypothetical protein
MAGAPGRRLPWRAIGAVVVALTGVLGALAGLPGVLAGQSRISDPAPTGSRTRADPQLWLPTRSFDQLPRQPSGRSIAEATLFSAVLPGAGQHILGQNRKWIYLALEAVGWVGYVDRRSDARALSDEYRDFAWTEARLQSGERMDGDFAYYETLTKWNRSGVFDADPASSGVQPEEDPGTYNGSIWSLATKLFLGTDPGAPDPEGRQRALDYYGQRAYDSAFLWDWTGTGGAQGEYAGLITESDDRYRQATNILGVIIANHVVSTVDAFVSARRLMRGANLDVVPSSTPLGTRWHARVGIRVGW